MGDEFQVNDESLKLRGLDVAALVDGGFVVTFLSRLEKGSYAIKAAMFDAEGNKIGDEIQVSDEFDYKQYTTAVTTMPCGCIIIAWSTEAADENIYIQKLDDLGNKSGSTFQANSQDDNQSSADVAAYEDGFVAVWYSEYDGILAQSFVKVDDYEST